jgi:hypothetical protein
VLPEGFNIGTFYATTEDASCNFNPDVLSRLLLLSKDYLVSFVAVLIVRENGGPEPPFSSAYLVGQAQWRLISRKHLDDNFSKNKYTPCDADFDAAQPIEHTRATIAALICRDFSDYNCSDNPSRQRAKRLQDDESCTLLCVPACTNKINPYVQPGCADTGADWPNKIVVMANSNPYGSSFITNRLRGFKEKPLQIVTGILPEPRNQPFFGFGHRPALFTGAPYWCRAAGAVKPGRQRNPA